MRTELEQEEIDRLFYYAAQFKELVPDHMITITNYGDLYIKIFDQDTYSKAWEIRENIEHSLYNGSYYNRCIHLVPTYEYSAKFPTIESPFEGLKEFEIDYHE